MDDIAGNADGDYGDRADDYKVDMVVEAIVMPPVVTRRAIHEVLVGTFGYMVVGNPSSTRDMVGRTSQMFNRPIRGNCPQF